MKRPIVLGFCVLVGLAGWVTPTRTQISVEIRGGLALPTGDFADLAETGTALGAELIFNFSEYVGAYAGYGRGDFDCDEDAEGSPCDPLEEFESSGFVLGVKGRLPLESPIVPWARVGAIFHDIKRGVGEAEGDAGFEVGLGVDIPLGDLFVVAPQARYRSYTVTETIDVGTGPTEVTNDVAFFSAELGLQFRFGSRR